MVHRLDRTQTVFLRKYNNRLQIGRSHVGVTTEELITKILKEENKNLSSKELLERYLYPLRNQGLVDSIDSIINKSRKVFFPSSTAAASESFFHSFMDEKNESFDNMRFKVINYEAYPSKDVLEMQIMTSLKHSSKSPGSEQENNSLPKILDETCKNEKNARMFVEEVFSFPEKYFTKGWLDVKPTEADSQRINKDKTTAMNTSHDNISTTVATSLIPTLSTQTKNEVDPVSLNEFLSVIE